jgi:hypothetical protein
MDRSVETYQPSRLYARVGWAALAGSVVCVLCGLRAPLALIPGALCAITSGVLFWISARPTIRVEDMQFNIGNRAIAWREICEINTSRFVSPLVLRLRLTNSRRKTLIYPGDPERIAKLLDDLRRHSSSATFDGIAYRDYWTWNDVRELSGKHGADDQPVRMLSKDDENEIERMYQKLKSVRKSDSRDTDQSKASHED